MVRQPYPESAFLWPQFVRVEQDGSVVQQVHMRSSVPRTRLYETLLPPYVWSVTGHVSTKQKPGNLCSDYKMIWAEEWDRGKARDHFHKVSCVRLLGQAKKNITSIALIKAQTRWWQNNDVRATALVRTHRKKVGASNHSTLLAVTWYSPVSTSLHLKMGSTKLSGKWRNTLFLIGSSFKAIA